MNKFYQLKITLKDVSPPIWRSFVVPASITLDRLHDVIQIVMGWEDCHLHSFKFKKTIWLEEPKSADDEDEALTRLNELLKKSGNSLIYNYDFGDAWVHEIVLENKNFIKEDAIPTPFGCIEGRMRCPMEDSGGPAGHMHLLDIISEPHKNKEDFEALLDFIEQPDADPQKMMEHLYTFDSNEVNATLVLYARWSRDRPLPLAEEMY
ncbi:plasmid pRiA4b ORF-3 family protein [Klebsiella michiganensis]|uniref:Plasmid pRiA4b ORF-3 family protein n=2 Tax=Klebsiella/Raoultella group TaxID=2890311 RepID=A0A6P1UW50_9ENTR|nr:plasmid pRiA4b ORF-3 family protein [Klebsiella michiganensis]MEB8291838.1 plasmid pRiA4b ORF-3 family protein [Klebsiella michiganensis]MXJ82795.1 plasmid pRiA4b ORF-3 family protein [Klebsiella michiganensis]QHS47151.1 plasmid pRiA4b ORF-3 family protein [Klebsiella michiganensis]